MSLINYLKKNGVKRAFQVIYQYKIHNALCKIMSIIYKKKDLIDAIVIESHNDFDSNGGVFYDYLVRNGYNRRYKIVWLLKHHMPADLPENTIGLYLYKPSLKKAYYVCRAKYFTADNVVTEKVRDDQRSFYFTHGAVGLKSVRGIASLPDSIDYVLSPSENYDSVLARELSLQYPNNKMIHFGYPSHDVFFEKSDNDVKKITTQIYRKIILWMPTFRKGGGYNRNDSTVDLPFGIPLIENDEMFNKMQLFLGENNVLLIIKIHPMQDPSTLVKLKDTDNIKILTGELVKKLNIDNYRLLKNVDALISDYSSIAYSYLLLNRPLAFALSDLKDYKLGFSVDNPDDFLVGNRIYSYSDLIQFLKETIDEKDPYRGERERLTKWLYKYCDGKSCERIVEFMEL